MTYKTQSHINLILFYHILLLLITIIFIPYDIIMKELMNKEIRKETKDGKIYFKG